MPRISAFYGIVIRMYYDEVRHEGRPHFHAVYQGQEASVDATDLSVLAGTLPPNALRLVTEWAALHREELFQNWERARLGERLARIAPLS